MKVRSISEIVIGALLLLQASALAQKEVEITSISCPSIIKLKITLTGEIKTLDFEEYI